MSDVELALLSKAEQMLAEVARADDARKLADMAEAARVYARKAELGTAAINHATVIKARALKRMAELVDEGQARGEIATREDGANYRELVRSDDKLMPATLTDLGITRQRLHEARKLEAVSESDLAEAADSATRSDKEVSLAAFIREAKRAELVTHLESIETREAKAAVGLYDVLVIDPPWPMQKVERDCRPMQVGLDYPTMDEEDLASLAIPYAADAHVWLWTTHKHLPTALGLLAIWGLKYVCTFVWHKPGGMQPVNLPQYNCEFALYARRGTPTFIDTKAFNVCFEAPRGAHSEKPEEFYALVRRVTAGRRLDMFARRQTEGFDAWGKEAPDGCL